MGLYEKMGAGLEIPESKIEIKTGISKQKNQDCSEEQLSIFE